MPKSDSESRAQRAQEILARNAREANIPSDAPPLPHDHSREAPQQNPEPITAAPPPSPRLTVNSMMQNRASQSDSAAVVTGRSSDETFGEKSSSSHSPDDVFRGLLRLSPEDRNKLMEVLENVQTSTPGASAEDDIKQEPEVIPEESRVVRHSIKGDRAQTGWRGFLAKLGFPIEKSQKELQQEAWLRQIQRPIDGGKVIGVMSFKGGVGKTTLAVSIGTAIHIESDSPVSVVDIDPNGTLKMRSVDKQPSDVQTLAERLRGGTKALNAYAAKTFEKVDLYGSKDHLSDGELSQEDVHDVLTAMRREYPVTVVDMPIYSQNNDAILAAVRIVDCLVVVIPPVEESLIAIPQVEGALRAIDAENLTKRVVFAFNQHDGYSATDGADIEEIANELIDQGFNVVEIPYDTGLRNINRFAFEDIRSSTRWQFVQLSAAALAAAR